MGKLTILVGLPRSGKSTYSKWWREFGDFKTDNNSKLTKDITPRVHVSEDELQLALHGCRYSSLSEPLIKNLANIMIRKYLDAGYDVLADDTHTSVDSLLQKLKIDPEADIKFHWPWRYEDIEITYSLFEKYIDTCKQRAIETLQSDLLPVIDNLAPNMWKLISQPEIIDNLRLIAYQYKQKDRVITL